MCIGDRYAARRRLSHSVSICTDYTIQIVSIRCRLSAFASFLLKQRDTLLYLYTIASAGAIIAVHRVVHTAMYPRRVEKTRVSSRSLV